MNLSVITPTFNRKNFLQKNLDSVFSQKVTDIEHIIVDNLSDDGTDELIRDYQKKAPYKVIYIRERDSGIYNAMNKGIKIARGTWIHILNSDDYYLNGNVIDKISDKQNSEFDVLATPIEYFSHNEKKLWIPEYDEKKRHHNFPHPGVFIKKEFYWQFGFYDERFRMSSDAVFMAVHFPKAKIKILDVPSVRMSGEGLSSRITIRNIWERFITVMYYHNFPLSYKIRLFLYMIIDFRKEYLRWPQRKNNINQRIS